MGGINIINSVDDAMEFLRWLSEQNEVALDTETTSLDWYARDFKVRIVQFGSTQEAWVMSMQRWHGVIEEAVRRFHGTINLHNASFDVKALARHGITVPWHQIDDTLIAMRLSEPHLRAGLKEAAQRHVSPSAVIQQQDLKTAMRKSGWDWDTVPEDFPAYIKYAALDVVLTSRLKATKACRRGLLSPVYDLEMQTRQICTRMEQNGMRIDREYCRAQLEALRTRSTTLAEMVTEHYGVSVSSPAQLGKRFMDLGAVITKSTGGGQPSVDKEVLSRLHLNGNEHVSWLAGAVLDYRSTEKVAASYLEPFLTNVDDDGLVHASIESVGTKTGRMGVTEPALQTMPKPGESANSRLVRSAVIPRRESELLVSADFEQIEFRLIAYVSGDPGLIEAFHVADADPEADFFAEMGKVVYAEPSFEKSDYRRRPIKNTMYGMGYGAGPAKISITAGIPEEQAFQVRTSILGAFPGMSRVMQRFEHEVKEHGEITTLRGRRIVVDPNKAYRGLNAFIQGTAADLFKESIVGLAHAGFEDLAVIPVHDEMVFSIPKEDIEEARHVIDQTMTITDIDPAVPVSASPGLATWGDDH